jgi:hypothetical protein
MRLASAALFCVVLSAAPAARAGEVPPEVKEAIAYFDKYASKAKDDGKYAQLVADLAATQDPAAAERIAKILFDDNDQERKQIAADSLGDFKKNPAGKETAGKALVKGLGKDYEMDLKVQIVEAIGTLGYTPGCIPVCDAIRKDPNPWMKLRGVRTLGKLGDLHALPTLLYLLELFPKGIHNEAGEEVVVDTGTAGDGDQKAAEAKYKAQNSGPMGGRTNVDNKIYVQELERTLLKLTNDATIDSAEKLREWMVARTEQLTALGIEIPKLRKKNDDKKGDDAKK